MNDHPPRRLAAVIFAVLVLLSCLPAAFAADITNLGCEYLTNPLGIDVAKPRLSWVIADAGRRTADRGQKQTAYQVLVASTPELLTKDQGDLWDSGKVASDQSIQVEYGGKALTSRTRCYWKVRVWLARRSPGGVGNLGEGGDKDGHRSTWSQPALWTMGLLNPKDWEAAWIKPGVADQNNAPSHWLRQSFDLELVPARASAYVNVMGYFELYVNGQKVGTDVLSPAVSLYSKRSYVLTYDVTPYLRPGRNRIGLWTSRGWYWPGYPGVEHPSAIARLQLELEGGGQRSRIGTDGTWTTRVGNRSIIGSWHWNNFGGESVDARRDEPGWCLPGSDETGWSPANVIAAPPAKVAAQMCRPNRIGQRIPCVACVDLGLGRYELDFGTMLLGWLRLRLPHLPAGQRVVMYFADKRYETPEGDPTPAGFVKTSASTRTFATARGPVAYQTFNQVSEFISAGRPGETFQNKFNYAGFRYVIVEGLPAAPTVDDATALPVEGDLNEVGSFDCSNDLLNRIYRLVLRSNRSWSMGGYLAEHVRERLGYGPIEYMQEPTIMTLDMPALFTKWMDNWLDDQRPDGWLPFVSPRVMPSGGGPAWSGTVGALPWAMYVYYGDRRMIEKCYQPARRYLDFLQSWSTNNLLVRTGPNNPFAREGGNWVFIGDWCAPAQGMDSVVSEPPDAPQELFNNCYRVYLWQLLERSARLLGKTREAEHCATRISEIRRRIHETYYDPQKHTYVLDRQTYKCLPLLTGVVPEAERAAVLKALDDGILVQRQGHLDTGALGSWFLIQYLQEIDRNDLMFTMVNQKTYPGWGYLVEQGATSLWEQWNGFWGQSVNCFPAIGHWFQQALAGIRADETGPGFKKILIKPAVVGDLTWVKGSYDSIHGRIDSHWQHEGNKLHLDITIPANTSATVFVPAKDAATVTESGKPAAQAEGVKFLRLENNAAVYAVGSGTYRFQSTLPETIK